MLSQVLKSRIQKRPQAPGLFTWIGESESSSLKSDEHEAREREETNPPSLSLSGRLGSLMSQGRVHFGSEGGGPNGNMVTCLGGV